MTISCDILPSYLSYPTVLPNKQTIFYVGQYGDPSIEFSSLGFNVLLCGILSYSIYDQKTDANVSQKFKALMS